MGADFDKIQEVARAMGRYNVETGDDLIKELKEAQADFKAARAEIERLNFEVMGKQALFESTVAVHEEIRTGFQAKIAEAQARDAKFQSEVEALKGQADVVLLNARKQQLALLVEAGNGLRKAYFHDATKATECVTCTRRIATWEQALRDVGFPEVGPGNAFEEEKNPPKPVDPEIGVLQAQVTALRHELTLIAGVALARIEALKAGGTNG